MKKLYLIRHGQSEANVNWEIMRTMPDDKIPITQLGYQDSIKAADKLKALVVDPNRPDLTYVVSPYTRARQTFYVIKSHLGISSYPTISDICYEHFMNLPNHPKNWDKFLAYRDSNWDIPSQLNVKFTGGETMAQTIKRAETFVEQLKQSDFDHIVVVSHGQFIRFMLSYISGIHPKDCEHPLNGCVIEVELK